MPDNNVRADQRVAVNGQWNAFSGTVERTQPCSGKDPFRSLLGIGEENFVEIASSNGRLVSRVHLDPTLRPGVVTVGHESVEDDYTVRDHGSRRPIRAARRDRSRAMHR
jgi:hypothetical protein